MNLSLEVPIWKWDLVAEISQSGFDTISTIKKKAGEIPYQGGCYSWQNSRQVLYCGSFSNYNDDRFKSNLQGRIHNYLHNHSVVTNKRIFDNIKEELKRDSISLHIFRFETLQLNNETITFAAFSQDHDLVLLVEQLLICAYRRQEQCKWNLG